MRFLQPQEFAESGRLKLASKEEKWQVVMQSVKEFMEQVSLWPQVSTHPHRFGGTEFRFRAAEIGHIHSNGTLDIPFPRAVHDLLVDEGLAEQHHWVPDSGWITFHIRASEDLEHALWLLRLSFLRYRLKFADNPRELFENESEELALTPRLRAFLEPFLPRFQKSLLGEPISA